MFSTVNHFNQSVMLYSSKGFNAEAIKSVFNKILSHHDALRMIYDIKDEKIIQYNRKWEEDLFSFEIHDLTDDENFIEKIGIEADRLQKSIDLAKGPLVVLGLFKTKEGDHLLIVIHHLVIDGVSWRILLEDFDTGYQKYMNNSKIEFLSKTDSYQKWAEELTAFANSEELLKEVSYWKNVEETKDSSIT